MKQLLCLLAIAALAAPSTLVADEARPNFIFLFADDQRPDTISAWGNPHIQTPNFDRLAAEGMSFRQNYCAGSYSGAVCVASRTMLMTGRHWHRIDDTKNWSGLPLLPEALEAGGYRTHIIGKWHNGEKTLFRSFQTGSQVFVGGMSDHEKVPLSQLSDRSSEDRLTKPVIGEGFSSTLFADAAIDFLQADDRGADPFFLYVALTAPHDPRQPVTPFREHYAAPPSPTERSSADPLQ